MVDQFLPVQVAEEDSNRPDIGFNRLGGQLILPWLEIEVLQEFRSLLEFDDKPPEVVTGDSIDILPIRLQELSEVGDT